MSILGEPLVKGILYYIINKLHCCFNGCLSPKAAWFSVTLAGLDLGLGNLPELLHHHWRIVGFLRPHRASGELEESLFLRSRERARLVLHSFSKVLWDQRFRNESLLYLLWCVRTNLETFPVLGWKCQLITWKGRVHRAYLGKSDKNGIQEMAGNWIL